jgi:hypothetical protein
MMAVSWLNALGAQLLSTSSGLAEPLRTAWAPSDWDAVTRSESAEFRVEIANEVMWLLGTVSDLGSSAETSSMRVLARCSVNRALASGPLDVVELRARKCVAAGEDSTAEQHREDDDRAGHSSERATQA